MENPLALVLSESHDSPDELFRNVCSYMPWVKNCKISTTRQIAEHFHFDYGEAVAYGERLLHNLQQYGAATWYDWCWQNWGCKWNTRNSAAAKLSETSAQVDFITPWSPPTPVIRTLSLKFPEHVFTLDYVDYEGGLAGLVEIKDGTARRQLEFPVTYSSESLRPRNSR